MPIRPSARSAERVFADSNTDVACWIVVRLRHHDVQSSLRGRARVWACGRSTVAARPRLPREFLPRVGSTGDELLRRDGRRLRGLRPHQVERDLSLRMALVEVGERVL